jgi:DNA-binding NtrC family response regulator
MKRILIVDDEQLLLEGLRKALQTSSRDITTVETGASARTEISSRAYNLCFLDVFLPDLDGIELLKQIRNASPETKVIMMTAGIMSDVMKETIEHHAYMFMPKPFDLLQVRMLTQRILEIPTA